jgi:hypothetical protein
MIHDDITEGNLEVKLPTYEQMVQQRGKSQRREKKKKEDLGVRKWMNMIENIENGEHGRKVVKHCVFPMRWAFGGSKSIGPLKRRMRCHLVR